MIRPMLGESPISVFMVTVGLGSVLVGAVEIVWARRPAAAARVHAAARRSFIGEALVSRRRSLYGFMVAVC